MRIHTVAIIVACSVGNLCAKEGEFKPVEVSDGPILYFVHPEDAQGRSASGPERDEVVYLFDPSRHRPGVPQVLSRANKWVPRPVTNASARPLPHLLLMEWDFRVSLVDLRQGTSHRLLNDAQTKVVAVEGSKVFFLERTVPWTSKQAGLRLGTGEDGKSTIVESYYKPSDYLRLLDVLDSGASKRLGDVPIEHVLEVRDDGIWAIAGEKKRHLVRISRQGEVDSILAIDDQWLTPLMHHKFSLDGKHLAISTLHAQRDFHSLRELIVINIEKKRTVFSKERILLGERLPGGQHPRLELVWLDNRRLAFASLLHAPAVLDVLTNTETDGTTANALDEMLRKFDSPARPLRYFDQNITALHFKGEKQPIYDLYLNHQAVSPEGEWAAYRSEIPKVTIQLVNGKTKHIATLIDGWAYDMRWLEVSKGK